MSSAGTSFQRGIALLVFYTVGRLAESASRDEQRCCDDYFFHNRFNLVRER